MTHRDCSDDEGPRERLLAHGPSSLTDAEVLAVLLRTGVAGVSALEIARDLLTRHRGLSGVMAAPASELALRRGLGPAKVAQLKAGGFKVVHMVPKEAVKTLPQYDEAILKDQKLPTVSQRPTSSVVKTISEVPGDAKQ